MSRAAADLELDEGGAAKFGPRFEVPIGGGVEGRLGGALTTAEEAEGPVARSRPALGQLDLLAAETGDSYPALIAGPFFRGDGAHKTIGAADVALPTPDTQGSRTVFLPC